MKKYGISLAIIALAFLFGCSPSARDNVTGKELSYPASGWHKVDFEGHTYIVDDGGYRGGLCHDPNCKCHKEAKKEEHVYENPNQN